MHLFSRLRIVHSHDAIESHRRHELSTGMNGDIVNGSRGALVNARHAQHAQVHTRHTTRRVAHDKEIVIGRGAAASEGTIADLDGVEGSSLCPRVVKTNLVVTGDHCQLERGGGAREELDGGGRVIGPACR